jgi:hypothetical protein
MLNYTDNEDKNRQPVAILTSVTEGEVLGMGSSSNLKTID